MQIILTRLQNSKTENLSIRFVRFYHFISAHDDKGYSADFFIQVTDKVQAEYECLVILYVSVQHYTNHCQAFHAHLFERHPS